MNVMDFWSVRKYKMLACQIMLSMTHCHNNSLDVSQQMSALTQISEACKKNATGRPLRLMKLLSLLEKRLFPLQTAHFHHQPQPLHLL